MTRLIIHPGSPKTGTSSLQAFMKSSEADFRDVGVDVATPWRLRKGRFMRRYRGAFHKGRKMPPELFDEFAAEFAGVEIAFVSEEGFCNGFMPASRPESPGIDKARLSASLIARLPFDEIRVVLTIREQSGLLKSSYVHQVRRHQETRSFERWLADAVDADALSWAAAIDPFVQTFGAENVAVLPFEIVKAEGMRAYIAAFLKATRLDVASIDRSAAPALNISTSSFAVSASRRLNRIVPGEKRSRWINAKLNQRFPKGRYKGFAPHSEALGRVATSYRDENAALAERFFPVWKDAFLAG